MFYQNTIVKSQNQQRENYLKQWKSDSLECHKIVFLRFAITVY